MELHDYSSPAVADGKVYMGSYDGKVYCLNASTGAKIWSYTTGGEVESSPAVAYGNVYVGAYDNKVYAFGPTTYTLTITATAGGTTSPSPGVYTHAYCSSVEVTAIPDTNYAFDHWELDGVNVGSVNPYSVLMDDNHTLHAVFVYLGIHDVAVTNVTVCYGATIVHGGQTCCMDVTVENEGDFTETFNVTVYWNTTEIETKEVTLTSGNITYILFSWDTTGLTEYANYTIRAYAHPVSGENDPTDNNYIDGTITIVHLGDVNCDKWIEQKDLYFTALQYGWHT